MEVPLTVAAIGAIIAPVLAAVQRRTGSGARLGRHHGRCGTRAVDDGESQAAPVGRHGEVGRRRERRRVGQQVDERPAGELAAVDVEALRTAVVAGEVQVGAVG